MRDTGLIAVIVGVAVLATLIDFSGRFLSMLSDGLLMALLVGCVIYLRRFYRSELRRLRDENERLRRLTSDASRNAALTEAIEARREWSGRDV